MIATTTGRDVTTTTMRPRYEGTNIRTWVGFKHLMYVVEEGVLEWLREHGAGPQRLFHEHGFRLVTTDASVLLSSLVDIDDRLQVEAEPRSAGEFVVTLRALRCDQWNTAVRGRLRMALLPQPGSFAAPPPALHDVPVVPGIAERSGEGDDLEVTGGGALATLQARAPRCVAWSWVARYFYCHHSDRVQHSAYVRALEEGADRYLAERGLSIWRMLHERGWIPVVSRARVRLLAVAYMEEVVHTTFAVGEIVRNVAYECRMDCYVEREGTLVHVAEADMLQGYASSRGADAGRLVTLDAETLRALRGC